MAPPRSLRLVAALRPINAGSAAGSYPGKYPRLGLRARCAAKLAALRHSDRLLQLIEDRGILQRRDVLLDLLPLRDRAQQPPHDLARARLRQVVAEADVLGLGDGTDLLADPVAQLLRDLLCLLAARARAL